MLCYIIDYAVQERSFKVLDALRSLGESPWLAEAVGSGRTCVVLNINDYRGNRSPEAVAEIWAQAEAIAFPKSED
jgi:hypothetical protein